MISLGVRPLLTATVFGLGSLSAISAFGQSSASLHGRVIDADGRPLQNAVVQLVSDQTSHNSHAWRYTLIGDSLGKFSQEGLAPGAYLVMLFADGKGTNVLQTVHLKVGDTQLGDLALPTGSGSVPGLMASRQRSPAPGR